MMGTVDRIAAQGHFFRHELVLGAFKDGRGFERSPNAVRSPKRMHGCFGLLYLFASVTVHWRRFSDWWPDCISNMHV